jgi:hypothetical protein
VSTPALAIRDAIFDRVNGWPGFNEFRRAPHVQVHPDKLPSLAVYLMGETMRPDGDANAGEPKFVSDVVVAVAVIRKAGDAAALEGAIDVDVTDIETALLSDMNFVHFKGEVKAPAGETWTLGDPVYWNYDLKHATNNPDGAALTGFAEAELRVPGYWRVSELFEGVTQITRRHSFPQNGETYFAEVRLEMTFQVRVGFDPVVPDDYRRTVLITRQLNADPNSPSLTTVIDVAS